MVLAPSFADKLHILKRIKNDWSLLPGTVTSVGTGTVIGSGVRTLTSLKTSVYCGMSLSVTESEEYINHRSVGKELWYHLKSWSRRKIRSSSSQHSWIIVKTLLGTHFEIWSQHVGKQNLETQVYPSEHLDPPRHSEVWYLAKKRKWTDHLHSLHKGLILLSKTRTETIQPKRENATWLITVSGKTVFQAIAGVLKRIIDGD